MNLEEVKGFLESNKDSEEIKGYLAGFSTINTDKVNDFLQTDEGRSLKDGFNSEFLANYTSEGKGQSKAIAKAIAAQEEVWRKENGLELSPIEKELKEIKEKLAFSEKDKLKEALRGVAISTGKHKSLHSLYSGMLGEDEEKTIEKITNFDNSIDELLEGQVQSLVEERFKTAPQPPQSQSTPNAPLSAFDRAISNYKK